MDAFALYYPLFLLGLGILTIFVLILYFRVNAFLALIGAALLVGLLSPRVILTTPEGATEPQLSLMKAPEQVAFEFGKTMGNIGLVIALATIVGKALMDSGAADRIVRFFTRLFGESYAGFALLLSGFVLAVPVFFDTVFFLLVPLAKALRVRTGHNYLLYVMAIGAGGAVTHSLVPPTPGPVGMALALNVDVGWTIMVGLVVGAPISLVGYAYASLANRLWPVPLRQVGTVTLEELEQRAKRPDHELPSLFVSFLPIVLPVILITSSTIFDAVVKNRPDLDSAVMVSGVAVTVRSILGFIGERNIALLFAAIAAMWLVARQKQMTRRELGTFTGAALDEAGMILLITSAGGAFGAMLAAAGVGETLRVLAKDWGISLLVLSWGVAVLFKIAQGSGTVAMITTAGIVAGILTAELGPDGLTASGEKLSVEAMTAYLGYHPVYLIMAMGCGSVVGSWMNDSGYWVVCKMSGMTEGETFKSWTATLVVMGIAGLPLIWLLTKVLPLKLG